MSGCQRFEEVYSKGEMCVQFNLTSYIIGTVNINIGDF